MSLFIVLFSLYSFINISYAETNTTEPHFSWNEFINAIKSNGYPTPKQDQYISFTNRTADGNITSKVELSMFLAQIIVESGGLQYKRELACLKDGCPTRYDHSVGIPGQNYYGRGYIQLTHSYNYKEASLALYGDDRLVKNADLVASDEDAAWGTAYWYWAAKVHNMPGLAEGEFGVTTLAINGGLCKYTKYLDAAKHRFAVYKKVLIAGNVNVVLNEKGCYAV